MRQNILGKQWGAIAQIAGQISIFVSIIILSLSMVTAYNTTLSSWLANKGIHISFWVFALIIFCGLLIAALMIWKYALPSYLSSLNEQIYKHDNPIRQDIAKLAQETEKIKEMMENHIKEQE